jgi:hypothetical protein
MVKVKNGYEVKILNAKTVKPKKRGKKKHRI